MKRRNLVLTFMLVAALTLGIGYAALSDALDINGTVTVNQTAAEAEFDLDVYFSDAVAGSTTDLASVLDTDHDMANFTVNSLATAGNTATFTFTIKNDSDLDAYVTPTFAADGNTNAEYFDIVSDWNGQPKTITAGGEMDYTLTITLKKTPTDTIHGSFHIELTAEAVSR